MKHLYSSPLLHARQSTVLGSESRSASICVCYESQVQRRLPDRDGELRVGPTPTVVLTSVCRWNWTETVVAVRYGGRWCLGLVCHATNDGGCGWWRGHFFGAVARDLRLSAAWTSRQVARLSPSSPTRYHWLNHHLRRSYVLSSSRSSARFLHDMLSNWDKYGRFSLDLASTATTIGFSTAKACTRLGVRYFYFHVQSTTNS